MSIVSNASALINLARIGKLDLLRKLYGELIVPEAVWQGSGGARGQGSGGESPPHPSTSAPLHGGQDLDAGEAEAIALALETEAELLLMDEHLGRETARHLGLRYTGLIGALIEAKHKGLIRAVKPHLDALRDVAGFRVSDALYRRVLQDEGEA